MFKGDDDIVLVPENLLNLLSSLPASTAAIGNYKKSETPISDMANKYYTPPEMFDETFYPAYFSGAAYVFRASFALKMVKTMDS